MKILLTHEEQTYVRQILSGYRREEKAAKDIIARIDGHLSPPALTQKYQDYAREHLAKDGACEIDDNAPVSHADDGAYICAWTWIPKTKLTKK